MDQNSREFKYREIRRRNKIDQVSLQLSELLGRPVNKKDFIDLESSDHLSELYSMYQNATMLCVPNDGSTARIITTEWAEIEALIPTALQIFDSHEQVIWLHEETPEVGGLAVSVHKIFDQAEKLAKSQDSPGIALVSIDGLRGFELDFNNLINSNWSLLWWRMKEPNPDAVSKMELNIKKAVNSSSWLI